MEGVALLTFEIQMKHRFLQEAFLIIVLSNLCGLHEPHHLLNRRSFGRSPTPVCLSRWYSSRPGVVSRIVVKLMSSLFPGSW